MFVSIAVMTGNVSVAVGHTDALVEHHLAVDERPPVERSVQVGQVDKYAKIFPPPAGQGHSSPGSTSTDLNWRVRVQRWPKHVLN